MHFHLTFQGSICPEFILLFLQKQNTRESHFIVNTTIKEKEESQTKPHFEHFFRVELRINFEKVVLMKQIKTLPAK